MVMVHSICQAWVQASAERGLKNICGKTGLEVLQSSMIEGCDGQGLWRVQGVSEASGFG